MSSLLYSLANCSIWREKGEGAEEILAGFLVIHLSQKEG